MRMRRSQNNRPFRRGPHKPRGMEGLPADEPDLPPSGAKPAEASAGAGTVPRTATPPDTAFSGPGESGAPATPVEPLPPGPHLEVEKLQAKPTRELKVYAKKEYEVENAATLKKHDLICEILKRNAAKNGTANGGGVLDLSSEGYGFLRSPRFNYITCPEDPYVSPSQVRRFGLRKGDALYGPVRAPKDKERYFALARVDKIEGLPAEEGRVRPTFDLLTPTFPNRRIFLEGKKGDVSMRAMDLICPLGFGQRGLIVAPPRTGKTILLQKVANAIMENNPGAYLMMMLDRRAAGGSDRHAAHGEGRGHRLDFRRDLRAPRRPGRDGDRAREAAGGKQGRRRDPARQHHTARPRLQHDAAEQRQDHERRRRVERRCKSRSAFSARRAISKRAAA